LVRAQFMALFDEENSVGGEHRLVMSLTVPVYELC
jgi:hypothetical protein